MIKKASQGVCSFSTFRKGVRWPHTLIMDSLLHLRPEGLRSEASYKEVHSGSSEQPLAFMLYPESSFDGIAPSEVFGKLFPKLTGGGDI